MTEAGASREQPIEALGNPLGAFAPGWLMGLQGDALAPRCGADLRRFSFPGCTPHFLERLP